MDGEQRAALLETLRMNSQYWAERRVDQSLVNRRAPPIPMAETAGKFGYVMRRILAEPGIVIRITDEGFCAYIAGKPIDENPYVDQGPQGWWRGGWEAGERVKLGL